MIQRISENIDGNSYLIIEKITNEFSYLMNGVELDDDDLARIAAIKNDKMKIQWIAVRYVLKKFFGTEMKVYYTDRGKPYLIDHSDHISISHSNEYVALMLSKANLVGVDIEQIHDRILKVRDKFLSETELTGIQDKDNVRKIMLYWNAKEALYKLYGRRYLDFRHEIEIFPFEQEDKGNFSGTIKKPGMDILYNLRYFFIDDNYSVVYCVK